MGNEAYSFAFKGILTTSYFFISGLLGELVYQNGVFKVHSEYSENMIFVILSFLLSFVISFVLFWL